MKVCLISPGWIATKRDVESMFTRCGVPLPLGLSYIASYAEKYGFKNIQILDLLVSGWDIHTEIDSERIYIGLPFDRLREKICEINPDVVGISCAFTSQAEALHIVAREVKKINSQTMVLVGGAHPSSAPKECLEDKNIDIVIRGEGEVPFLRLLKNNFKGDLSQIKGLYYRKGSELLFTGNGEYIKNLDEIPYPAYHKLDMEKYLEVSSKGLAQRGMFSSTFSVITSRGCPYQCVFCSIHNISGSKWRSRSPSNVLGEMDMLIKKYGAKHILFEDDNLTMDIKRAEEIFDKIAQQYPDISWSAPNGIRADRMTTQLAKSMKKSGCTSVSLGIESGDQKFLNNTIKKKLNLKKVDKTVEILTNAGITVIGFFILGIPGETEDSMETSINFAKILSKKGLIPHFFIVTPLPGTELYDIATREGLLLKNKPAPIDYFHATYQTPMLCPPERSIDSLLAWRKKAVMSTMLILAFYRPFVFLRYISGINSYNPKFILLGLKRKLHLALHYLLN